MSTAPDPVLAADIERAAVRLRGQIGETLLPRVAHPFGDLRLRGVPEVREPAVHGVVQGARRVQQDGAAHRRGACRRRALGLGRQPRPGGGVSRPAHGHRGDDRHAALRLVGEGGEHARLRRRGGAARRHLRRRRACSGSNWRRSAASRSSIPTTTATVIAGQGTVALEMLAQQPALDTLVVAIGGGGLIAGMATAARARRPDIRVVGVQTERFPAAWNAKHGQQRESRQATIADGIGVKSPGALTLPVIRDLRRRRRAGLGRRHRAGDPDAARRSRRPWSRAPARVGLAAVMKDQAALRRAQGRARALRRQHRAAGAGRDHRARHGQVGAPRAPSGRRPRRARRARRRRRAAGPARRQHRRGAAPARLHLALGRAGADRGGGADARRRAHRGRSSRRCAPRATTPSGSARPGAKARPATLPVQRAGRFSRKARTPSWKSALP